MARWLILLLALACGGVQAESAVIIDAQGVMRWRANNQELRLFGANYCGFSGSDYRMAGLVGADRKAMIATDMAHFARMGWDGLRLCSWGDWENADRAGNFIADDHSDLMDYLIDQAARRGITMLLTPIHTYNPNYPDRLDQPNDQPGFSRFTPRAKLGTDPDAIAAEANYIEQLLRHVNPYRGLALKDDPAIAMVELINEPVHQPEDPDQSIAYVNRLVGALRASGSQQLSFFNVSQDFRIAAILAQSQIDGVSFGWYPSGLVAGHRQSGNFLPAVADYPDMRRPQLTGKPRIVYEFDPADLDEAVMLPAMARTFRAVGAQFAAIFAYDMLPTAPFNLGWQTHFINLVHTPRQAISAVIAAEAMKRLPGAEDDFTIDYPADRSLLNATDAYINAGPSQTPAKRPRLLTRIAGLGASPLVDYQGSGAYFLDKISDGLWRLEVYPDQITVADPFAPPRLGRVVSRLYRRSWPMKVTLADLGGDFTLVSEAGDRQPAKDGAVQITPGVWLLSRDGDPDPARLPAMVGHLGLWEFHLPPPQDYDDLALNGSAAEFVAGEEAQLQVRLAAAHLPDQISVGLRASGSQRFHSQVILKRHSGDLYRAALPVLPPGSYDVALGPDIWHFRVTRPDRPLRIFDPVSDTAKLSFLRLDETHAIPPAQFKTMTDHKRAIFRLAMPDFATELRYAAALFIGDKIAARGSHPAKTLTVRLRGGALDLLLIEQDGTAWRGTVQSGADWKTVTLPLQALVADRSLLIPLPFPGSWDYWRNLPRERAGNPLRPQQIERLELRLEHRGAVDIERITLNY